MSGGPQLGVGLQAGSWGGCVSRPRDDSGLLVQVVLLGVSTGPHIDTYSIEYTSRYRGVKTPNKTNTTNKSREPSGSP